MKKVTSILLRAIFSVAFLQMAVACTRTVVPTTSAETLPTGTATSSLGTIGTVTSGTGIGTVGTTTGCTGTDCTTPISGVAPPTCNVVALPTQVVQGNAVLLSLNILGPYTAGILNGGTWTTTSQPVSVTPSATTTYTASITNGTTTIACQPASVTVVPAPTCQVTATPSKVVVGNPINLSMSVTGPFDTASLNSQDWTASSSPFSVTPHAVGVVTYTGTVISGSVTVTCSTQVTILKQTCDIFPFTNRHYGCGPGNLDNLKVYIPAVGYSDGSGGYSPQPNGQPTAFFENWGSTDSDGCYSHAAYPDQVTYQGVTYNITDGNGNLGSADCQVYPGADSPLVVDFSGGNPQLSAPNLGAFFDMMGTGTKYQYSWPSNPNSVLFLAYDKFNDGNIKDINQLFGNNTVGPDGKTASNGFEALKKFDENGDGFIDENDSIFYQLKLWSDKNENGISEPGELYTLAQKGIKRIDLHYTSNNIMLDSYGNSSRQNSTVTTASGTVSIYDLWLVGAALPPTKK